MIDLSQKQRNLTCDTKRKCRLCSVHALSYGRGLCLFCQNRPLDSYPSAPCCKAPAALGASCPCPHSRWPPPERSGAPRRTSSRETLPGAPPAAQPPAVQYGSSAASPLVTPMAQHLPGFSTSNVFTEEATLPKKTTQPNTLGYRKNSRFPLQDAARFIVTDE